jgi:hypothetical protein
MKFDMDNIVPEFLRELDVHLHDHSHGKAWLSAASGLVCAGDQAYVIADDEHHLGTFTMPVAASLQSIPMRPKPEPLTLIRMFEGDLPEDKKQRKQIKPDIESLSLLPPLAAWPHGALLAMGSGSRPSRCQAVLMPFETPAKLLTRHITLDLESLYAPLQSHFDDLNIEGAFVTDGNFHLLQRGNKRATNARITYSWPAIAAWLMGEHSQAPAALSIQDFKLGEIAGVPFGITDAAALHAGSWVFCAVAENTPDSYHDGACLGSIIGIVDAQGTLTQQYRLQGDPKVEGIAVLGREGRQLELWLVTDADDPQIAARLLRVILPLSQE